MVYRYVLVSVRDNDINYLSTFSPLCIGDIIGWGADDREENGIKQWVVVRQLY